MHKNILKPLVFSLLLTVTSCQKHTLFHSYQSVNAYGWENKDTLSFILENPLKNDTNYHISLGIRHLDSYKYQDIWLTINQDTLHLYLTDSTGNWKGNGIGESRQYTHPLSSISFSSDSTTTFHINHIMQDNPLKGITNIGLQIHY